MEVVVVEALVEWNVKSQSGIMVMAIILLLFVKLSMTLKTPVWVNSDLKQGICGPAFRETRQTSHKIFVRGKSYDMKFLKLRVDRKSSFRALPSSESELTQISIQVGIWKYRKLACETPQTITASLWPLHLLVNKGVQIEKSEV